MKWAFSFWPPEFKTVGIFSISFFVTETWHFSIFGFLKTVNEGFCWKISIFYSAKQSPLWSQHFFLSLTVFEIEHKRLNFPFFKSVPHSVLKIWHSKKAFCTKNNQIILFWKINYNCFFCRKQRHIASPLHLFYYYFFCVWPKAFFIFVYTVFPLGVLYPEHSQLAFDCVVIACSLESIKPGLVQGFQGPQWCGFAW